MVGTRLIEKRFHKKGFTLIELLVVISIIAVLLSVLMPALTKAKKVAKEIVCRSNMHQWGVVFTAFFIDNDGHTIGWPLGEETEEGTGYGEGVPGAEGWPAVLHEYYQGVKGIRFCPEAVKNPREVPLFYGDKKTAWNWGWIGAVDWSGSYGINDWAYSPWPGVTTSWGRPVAGMVWDKIDNVTKADTVPLLLECATIGGFPASTDGPLDAPVYPEIDWVHINRFAMDRHGIGGLNCLFMDNSTRRVGIKELWTLKWSKQFDTKGDWTLAGNDGVPNPNWPEWMRSFKDY